MIFIALSPIQPSVEVCWLGLLLTVRHAACFLLKICMWWFSLMIYMMQDSFWNKSIIDLKINAYFVKKKKKMIVTFMQYAKFIFSPPLPMKLSGGMHFKFLKHLFRNTNMLFFANLCLNKWLITSWCGLLCMFSYVRISLNARDPT